jgi:hypothetical protein
VSLAVAGDVDMIVRMHFCQHAVNTERLSHLVDHIYDSYHYQKSSLLMIGERSFYVNGANREKAHFIQNLLLTCHKPIPPPHHGRAYFG